MPDRPESSHDDDAPDDPSPSDDGDRGEGSRADERDFGDVDPRTLDSRRADHVKLDVDEFFERAFPPGTDEFAKFLEESDLLEGLPIQEGTREQLIERARANSEEALQWWKIGERPDLLRDGYAEWVLGRAPSERAPSETTPDGETADGGATTDLPEADDPVGPTDEGWAEPAPHNEVTLPDGGRLNVAGPPEEDSEGNLTPGTGINWNRPLIWIGGFGVLGLILLGGIWLGGSDETGDGGAAGLDSAASGSVGSSDAVADRTPFGGVFATRGPEAVIVHPCDVIDQALAASLTGTGSVRFHETGTRTRRACGFRPDADGGVELTMEVWLNNASGSSLSNWQSQHDDALEVQDVAWSSEGELRLGTTTRDFPRTKLWARVLTRPETRSDVYIIVSATVFKPPSSVSQASLTVGVETIAAMLNDAILEAQP